ncbi:MAG TPA: hypothetical protein VF384_03755 [Planctomycetota bacterium]
MSAPRLVLATRPTAFERLLARHGTAGQARFFLEQRGQSLADLQRRHSEQEDAVAAIDSSAPRDWRRARVTRAEFDRFLFQQDDVVVAVGQDGLVANLAKYLDGQPVVGANPSPDWFDGVLVPHHVDAVPDLVRAAAAGRARCEERTMLAARLDDGQQLLALNEVFVGHVTHQSARYRITAGEQVERQSSSGVVVASGTGASGWARSIHGMRHSRLRLPAPVERRLAWFVREAFPSQVTGTDMQEGLLGEGAVLQVNSEMDDGGVVFGDGIEADRLEFAYGTRLRVSCAQRSLRLVRA